MEISGPLGGALVVLVFLILATLLATAYAVASRVVARWRGPSASEPPARTAPATVVGKRQDEEPGDRFSGRTGYYVTFAPDGDEPVEFMMAGGDHERLHVGERGLLTYRGDRFQSFVLDSAAGRR